MELDALGDKMSRHLSRNEIDQYNALVPVYNQKAAELTAIIDETRTMAKRYNDIVAEYNNQVAAQDNLYDSINSNYQPATKN